MTGPNGVTASQQPGGDDAAERVEAADDAVHPGMAPAEPGPQLQAAGEHRRRAEDDVCDEQRVIGWSAVRRRDPRSSGIERRVGPQREDHERDRDGGQRCHGPGALTPRSANGVWSRSHRELRIAHADLDSAIDTMAVQSPVDDLVATSPMVEVTFETGGDQHDQPS